MLSVEGRERLFDELAQAIDRVGHANESLFLTKLVFALAVRLDDEEWVRQQIELAQTQLSDASRI